MKIEPGLRALVIFANLVLSAAFLTAWFQVPVASALHFESGLQFHLALATVAVLMALFSNLCVIFYFVGTGVWMRDQAREMLPIDKPRALKVWSFYEAANKLKGKAMPFPTMSLLLGVFTYIFGGARQVGAGPSWLHPVLASVLLICNWLAAWLAFKAMRENLALLDASSAEIDALA